MIANVLVCFYVWGKIIFFIFRKDKENFFLFEYGGGSGGGGSI